MIRCLPMKKLKVIVHIYRSLKSRFKNLDKIVLQNITLCILIQNIKYKGQSSSRKGSYGASHKQTKNRKRIVLYLQNYKLKVK